MFLYAAYTKLKAPWYMFAGAIDSYQMVPPWASEWIARTLPGFELLLGALLISGYRLRLAALVSGILLLAFWLSMATAFAKGLAIDCGCFGSGEAVSKWTLLRDGILVTSAAILWYFARPRGVIIQRSSQTVEF
ncbi:MAG: DoxX family membrane protein [Acidobacteriota bacterium]|nr:DoxX family membrane protein [Acidobacteriota bacterium]